MHFATVAVCTAAPYKSSPPLAKGVQVQPLHSLHGDLQHCKIRLGNRKLVQLWLAPLDLRRQAAGGLLAGSTRACGPSALYVASTGV